jgi:hypothetical protein
LDFKEIMNFICVHILCLFLFLCIIDGNSIQGCTEEDIIRCASTQKTIEETTTIQGATYTFNVFPSSQRNVLLRIGSTVDYTCKVVNAVPASRCSMQIPSSTKCSFFSDTNYWYISVNATIGCVHPANCVVSCRSSSVYNPRFYDDMVKVHLNGTVVSSAHLVTHSLLIFLGSFVVLLWLWSEK